MSDRELVYKELKAAPYELSVSEISGRTDIDASRLRPILDALVEEGLIKRETGPKFSSATEVYRVDS